jgi:hypothetical protein
MNSAVRSANVLVDLRCDGQGIDICLYGDVRHENGVEIRLGDVRGRS